MPAAIEPFYVVSNKGLRDIVRNDTPEVFKKRNVWVPVDFWESV